jgi:hypothetical protein
MRNTSLSNKDTNPDLGMAVPNLLPPSSQGDLVQHGNIILDHRRPSDDNAGGMINQNPLTAPGGCLDVHRINWPNQSVIPNPEVGQQCCKAPSVFAVD